MTSWLKVSVTNRYDAICSSFSADFYFDPESAADKATFRPGAYHEVRITHKGVLMLTGFVMFNAFKSAGDPPKAAATLAGYSKTGVLQDCQYGLFQAKDTTSFGTTNQFNNVNIKDIAERICRSFYIKVNIDKEVLEDSQAMAQYLKTNIDTEQTAADFLTDLCRQKNIILWHNARGELVLSKPKIADIVTTERTYVREDVLSGKKDYYNDPGNVYSSTISTSKRRAILFDFVPGTWIRMETNFDLKDMHYRIQVVRDELNYQSEIFNPYVGAKRQIPFHPQRRFRRFNQTASGKDKMDETPVTARAILSDELKGYTVTIHVDRWVLNGHLITPNQMVTIQNPDAYIYNKTKFFIQQVQYFADNVSETAILTCVLPDCFLSTEVKNIFG